MPAFHCQIDIGRGETFRWHAVWLVGPTRAQAVPVDLTGWSARLQVRATPQDAEVLLDMSTEPDGGIALGGAAGTIDLYLSHQATSALAWTQGVFQMEMTAPNGDVLRKMAGVVRVSEEVVRDD